ncbi:hypothetical protein E8E14_002682 [Neopestalotiopsis sp. 37M]|nr:hypothetical protein E8E14_002682 [Neopestalotiopsis sp. 37M]
MSIVALGLMIAAFVTNDIGIKVGSTITSGLVSWASKAPIPLLLIRLFGIKRWLRITAIVALTTSGIAILVATAWSAAACDSHGTYTPEFASKCFTAGSTGGIINGVFSLALDLVCFIMPLIVVQRLQLPFKQKLGLMLVFLTGILVIAVSAAGLYFKVESFEGSLGDSATSGTILIIESAIAIIVGCVPATYTFWNKFVTPTTLYSKIRSAVSRVSLISNRRTTDARSSRGDGANTGRSGSNNDEDVTYMGMHSLPKRSNDTDQPSEV